MAIKFVHMTCSKETKDDIMTKCVDEYFRHHPELKGMKITERHMLEQLKRYYLDEK